MYILSCGLVRMFLILSVVLSSQVQAQTVDLRPAQSEKKQPSIFDCTVRVRVVDPATGSVCTGAGVSVGNGKILTAAHIVGKTKEAEILLGNGDSTESFDGKVELVDSFRDLCLIQVVDAFEKPFSLPAIKITADFPVATGTRGYAVGNPLGFTLTVSEGIISACGVLNGEKYLLTDALIKSGNSGGPFVNQKGELLGLVVSTVHPLGTTPDANRAYGKIIPSADIQDFLAHPGAIYEGYLGVSGKTVSTGLGALNVSEGLQIERVLLPQSNLRVGDILTWVDESPITSPRSLINAIRVKTPGSKPKAFVIRQGVFTEITLLVSTRPK